LKIIANFAAVARWEVLWKPQPRQALARYTNMADSAQRKTLNII
jgi:hypothetical protein